MNPTVNKTEPIGWWTVEAINDFIKEKGLDPKEVDVEAEDGGWGDGIRIYLSWYEKKYSDEEFKVMQQVYKDKLEEFKKWARLNKKNLEEKERLLKEKAELEQRLQEIDSRLSK